MSINRFTTGQRLLIGGRSYSIERELKLGVVQLRDEGTNAYCERSVESLLEIFTQGNLLFLGDVQSESYADERYHQLKDADITFLPPILKEELSRRVAYVFGVREIGIGKMTMSAFSELASKIGHKLQDPKPPSAVQLYRWYRCYKSSGEDIKSLIPRYLKRGDRKDRLSYEETAIIKKKIEEKYLSLQRNSINDAHEAIVAEMERQNKYRPASDKLHAPSYQTIVNRIKKLDPYEVMKAREGKLKADRMYKPSEHHPQPTYPLERVEIDHTKLDLFVVDFERRMPIGRPWITAALDVATRNVLGYSKGFTPPSYASIMKCLQHSITPKGYVENKYPDIKHKWDCYGLPGLLVTDNGPEMGGNNLADAALQLGFPIQFAPVKLAWYKGAMERFFGTLNTRLLHSQPGTSFSNIFEKGEYDPKQNAVIDLAALEHILHKWIIDVYHRAPNKRLGAIPAIAWEQGIRLYPPAMPRDLAELRVLIGMTAERTITKVGIELHGLFYNDQALCIFRRELGQDGKVKIKFDPEDLSVIYIWDAVKFQFIPVLAVDQEYTRSLSLWQHNVIKRYTRENIKKDFSLIDLCIAKAEIQEIVDREWKKTKKGNTRVKMARWLGDSLESEYGKIERDPAKRALKAPANIAQEIDPHLAESVRERHFANGISMIGTVVSNPSPLSGPTDSMQEKIVRDLSNAAPAKVGKKGKSSRKSKKSENQGKRPLANRQDEAKENGELKKDLDLTGWDVGSLNH